MKTIRAPKDAARYHLECGKDDCRAVLEVSKDELRLISDPRDGTSYVLDCPHCKHETWFLALSINRYIHTGK